MSRFTVVWWREAQDDLANLWMTAIDPEAVTRAANEIDRLLTQNPSIAIDVQHEGLCRTSVEPLIVQFMIDDQDRLVTVLTVRTTT